MSKKNLGLGVAAAAIMLAVLAGCSKEPALPPARELPFQALGLHLQHRCSAVAWSRSTVTGRNGVKRHRTSHDSRPATRPRLRGIYGHPGVSRLLSLSTEGLAASYRPLILECPHRDLQPATPPMVFRFRRRVST